MARTPNADQPFLTFSRDHINVWSGGQAGPPVIGLSSQQLLDTEAATAAAEAAYQAMTVARNASKAATEAKDNAFAALRAVIGADIDTIDAFGKATNDPSVWVKAQIPAPKDPSEREAPPAPEFDPIVQNTGGVMRVGFKVTAGPGAQYQLQRRDTRLDGSTSDWFPIAMLTEKAYDDQAIPFGLQQVVYRVRAQISSGPASEWSNPVSFSFGSQGSQAGPQAKGTTSGRAAS